MIEHGEWQGEAIRELLTADGWRAAATHPDLTLRDRATTAIRALSAFGSARARRID